MCLGLNSHIDRIKEIDYNMFNGIENVSAINETCTNDKLFTPDGKLCYSCSDKYVGMAGCTGHCTFSLKRNSPPLLA